MVQNRAESDTYRLECCYYFIPLVSVFVFCNLVELDIEFSFNSSFLLISYFMGIMDRMDSNY